eukprot:Gb_29969 [translate_table: standard]
MLCKISTILEHKGQEYPFITSFSSDF